MPELPEVEHVRRQLEPFLVGGRIADVLLRRAGLRTAFPPDFCERLVGQEVRTLSRRGKYLLAELGSGDTLVMHLGMSGEFRIDVPPAPAASAAPREPDRHDHVVFTMVSGTTVTFNDVRRFGLMVLVRTGAGERHPALAGMGPEPLSDAFDPEALAERLHRRRTAIKVALLDQDVVAGVGNIYASEALHRAAISPFRRSGTLVTPSGKPRAAARRLGAAIKDVLTRAVARVANPSSRGGAFRVYDREGRPCLRRGCGGAIRRVAQAGRSTYYCPRCQR